MGRVSPRLRGRAEGGAREGEGSGAGVRLERIRPTNITVESPEETGRGQAHTHARREKNLEQWFVVMLD